MGRWWAGVAEMLRCAAGAGVSRWHDVDFGVGGVANFGEDFLAVVLRLGDGQDFFCDSVRGILGCGVSAVV